MEPPSPYTIPITNESGLPVQTRRLRRAVRSTLHRYGSLPGRLAILITSNAEIQELNRHFRKVDEPTDVLTFPASPDLNRGFRLGRLIGDVAISAEYAQAQAELRGIRLDEEVAYLGIHGALHLCGFDDVTETDRRRMQIAMAEMGALCDLPPDPEWSSVLHAAVRMEEPV